ncbi:MAG TPA: CerR family C-terminal domain-containing protein [Gemmatimonadales bacterium]|nr:CerR family C-terminal domain-containing protein [Gemmatimonadales bacterium]
MTKAGGRGPSEDTRRRLFEVARELFTDQGFDNVTVRDISRRAGANLAAINYHFGDKLALYLEIVRSAVDEMRATNDEMMAGPELPAAERLRRYVRGYVPRLMLIDQRRAWIQKLMRNEMSEPTPAAQLIIDEILRPRVAYLTGIVAELVGCRPDDPRVARSVSAIQMQCFACIPHPAWERVTPSVPRTPESAAAMAEHIIAFSLAGIEAVKQGG